MNPSLGVVLELLRLFATLIGAILCNYLAEAAQQPARRRAMRCCVSLQDLMQIDPIHVGRCSALFLFGRRRTNKSVSILEKFVHNHADLCG
jgi:hypothetical protein